MKIILIAYIPALHQGYLNFFQKYPQSDLYILSTELVREVPRLERDIRAIEPVEMQKAIDALGMFSQVRVLSKETVGELPTKEVTIVMPDEEVSKHFAETYLPGVTIVYETTFLRWNGHNAQKKNPPELVDRVISHDAFDKEIMQQAYGLTQQSPDWWRQIGAILLKDKKVLFIGFNRPLPSDQTHNIFGDPRSNFDYGVSFELSKFIHAEANIIAQAAKKGIALEGTEIYVTTYPCPVCAKSIALSGIKKVYYTEGYSLLDAEDILKGAGVSLIKVELN